MDVVCQIRLEDQGSCKELSIGIASPLKTAKDYTTLLHGLCHRTFIQYYWGEPERAPH